MNVRSAREDKGWSQEHLAAASGVSLRTVQRAEAGARVSSENTLALCAALDIRPADLPSAPVTAPDPRTLPHLEVLRSELDGAVAEFGEPVVWRNGDASPMLMDALGHMGLQADADGFAEAERLIRRVKGRLDHAELLLFPLVLLWCVGFIVFALHLPHFLKDFSGTWERLGIALTTWLALSLPLAAALAWMANTWDKVEPRRMPGVAHASVVASDLRPVEVALTQGFLWIARRVSGKAQVVRVRLDAIRAVAVSRTVDGSHSARFHFEGLSLPHDDGDSWSFELTRLRDEEAHWLERRFAVLRKAVVLSPRTA